MSKDFASSPLLIFADTFDLCQRTWWVREFSKNIENGIIISTNSNINRAFYGLFTLVSKREGFHISRNCVVLSFLDNGAKALIECNSGKKFLYIDNFESDYAAKKSCKWNELDVIEKVRDSGAKIIANEWLKGKVEADYYIRNMDFTEMEGILWQR